MSQKLVDNKRRSHAEKVLKEMSKKASKPSPATAPSTKRQVSKKVDPKLIDQYNIIRKDLMKLKDDLAKGYDMAKSMIEKKGFVRQLLMSK